MFFSKLTITLIGTLATAPFTLATTTSVPKAVASGSTSTTVLDAEYPTYANIIEKAANQQGNGQTATNLTSVLSANGGQSDIQTSVNKLGWGMTVTCDLTCAACASCADALGQAGIAIIAAYATAAIACIAIIDCPAAIATATVAASAATALFCNSQHQPLTCDDTCSWQSDACSSTLAASVPTSTVVTAEKFVAIPAATSAR